MFKVVQPQHINVVGVVATFKLNNKTRQTLSFLSTDIHYFYVIIINELKHSYDLTPNGAFFIIYM